MAENNKLLVSVGVMIFAAIAMLIILFLQKLVGDTYSSSSGTMKQVLEPLITNPNLLLGILWLIACIIVYFGVGYLIKTGEHIGPISLFFLLLWIFTVIGLFIGNVLWTLINGSGVNLTVDIIVSDLLFTLIYALGPSFAGALSISNKYGK